MGMSTTGTDQDRARMGEWQREGRQGIDMTAKRGRAGQGQGQRQPRDRAGAGQGQGRKVLGQERERGRVLQSRDRVEP